MAKKKKWSFKPIKIDIELLKANMEIMLADIPKSKDKRNVGWIGLLGQRLPSIGLGKTYNPADHPDDVN